MKPPPVLAWIAAVVVGVASPVVGMFIYMCGGFCCSGIVDPTAHAIGEFIVWPGRLTGSQNFGVFSVAVGTFWGGLAFVAGWLLSVLLPGRPSPLPRGE